MVTFVASTDGKYQLFRKGIHVLSYRVTKGEKAIKGPWISKGHCLSLLKISTYVLYYFLWLKNRLGLCDIYMGRGYSFMLHTFTTRSLSQEIPTFTFWERNIRKYRLCKRSSAFGVSYFMLSVLYWSCHLIQCSCRGRSRHDHTEKAQYFWGVVFYLLFGFTNQPLALD